MFAKKNRFSFKGPLPKKVLNFRSFSIRYGRNGDGLKVAVVVSKRVDKRATVRNKIKRQVLNSIRKKVNMEEPLDIIFYVKKNVPNSNDLEKEIEMVLSKIKQF